MDRDKLKRGRRGAVTMEYVIIGVLIAAACAFGVAMFSRSLFYALDTGARGATADSARAKQAQDIYRKDMVQESKDAKSYHDSMHTGKKAQP